MFFFIIIDLSFCLYTDHRHTVDPHFVKSKKTRQKKIQKKSHTWMWTAINQSHLSRWTRRVWHTTHSLIMWISILLSVLDCFFWQAASQIEAHRKRAKKSNSTYAVYSRRAVEHCLLAIRNCQWSMVTDWRSQPAAVWQWLCDGCNRAARFYMRAKKWVFLFFLFIAELNCDSHEMRKKI